jgi:hypothetical protein
VFFETIEPFAVGGMSKPKRLDQKSIKQKVLVGKKLS